MPFCFLSGYSIITISFGERAAAPARRVKICLRGVGMKRRLLVLSAPIGAGHVKAAEALCQTYIEHCGGDAFHVDFFRYSNPTLSHLVEQGYYLMTKHTPSVYKMMYNIEDRPFTPVKNLERFFGVKKFQKLIAEYRPDIILSTHFLPAAVTSYMYPRLSIPNGVVLTDYASHRMWVYPNNQRFFVAHEGMREELKGMDVEGARICVSGIPLRPCFKGPFDRGALRRALKFDATAPLILLMSGGNAIGPLVEVLENLAALRGNVQIAAIAGRNQKMYREMRLTMRSLGLRGRTARFVTNIHEWMAASDLLISKAGGLTVTEAMAVGLPMLVIKPTPGQEVANTMFLTKAGAALYLKDVAELTPTVANLTIKTAQLTAMRQAAAGLAKLNATEDILAEMNRL